MKLDNNIFSRNDKIAWQMIEEKVVLVSPKTMQIHILHGCGGRIWDHLQKPRSFEELVNLVYEEFETTKETASSDVNTFLDQLSKEELISCKN